MNWRKHIVLMVGGGVAVLLLLVALVLLFRYQGRYADVMRERDAARTRLQQLGQRNPFPSPANIERVKQNLAGAQGMAVDLQSRLQQGQIRPESLQSAEFAPLLEQAGRRLHQRAKEADVIVPAAFAVGFDRYAQGALPAVADLPRLVTQLRAVEALCQVLFQSRITELKSLDREQFDAAPQGGEESSTESRRPRRTSAESAGVVSSVPLAPENELYEIERLNVSFLAREASAWEVLNALARSPVLMAVVDVRFDNALYLADRLGKKTDVTPLGGAEKALSSLVQYPAHDDRIVAGREPVEVSLAIDVYRFNSAFNVEEAK